MGPIFLLRLGRSCFHLGFFHRPIVIFPMVPVNSFISKLAFLRIHTVEVRMATFIVPPCSFMQESAVARCHHVIISVFGGELHSVVINQRISSITLIINNPSRLNSDFRKSILTVPSLW